jgi:hypothetical protein
MDSTNWDDEIASRRTFGGCHSIHLSYGRDVLILRGDFTRIAARLRA